MSPRKPLSPDIRASYKGKKIPDFSRNLQTRRLELGLRQQDLANMLNIPRQRITEMESGRFPDDPERVWRIADALEISCDELLRQESAIKKSLPETGRENKLPEGFQELMNGAGALNMAIQAFLVEAARGTMSVAHVSKMYKEMMETVQNFNRLGLTIGSLDKKQA